MGVPKVGDCSVFDPGEPCLTKDEELVVVKKLGIYRDIVFQSALDLPGAHQTAAETLLSLNGKRLRDYVVLSPDSANSFIEQLQKSLNCNNNHHHADVWRGILPTYRLRNKLIDFALNTTHELSLGANKTHAEYMRHRTVYPFLGVYSKYKSICDLLVRRNLPLVKNLCAKPKMSGCLDFSDLYQEGCKGLIKAVERFDINATNRFFTYAYYWVNVCIDLAIKNKGRVVRIPVHTAVELNKLNASKQKITNRLGRTPSVNELSAETGIAKSKLVDFKSLRTEVVSVDDENAAAYVCSNDAPEKYVDQTLLNRNLLDALECVLPAKKVGVLVKRFGLTGKPSQPFKDIAFDLDSTEFSVRAAYYDALKKLKECPDVAQLFDEVVGCATRTKKLAPDSLFFGG